MARTIASRWMHPVLRNEITGTAEWFEAQRRMIRQKPLIRRCYALWYEALLQDADSVPEAGRSAAVVELGSGSSFIKEIRPDVLTSDIVPGDHDVVLDARVLPFRDGSVRALLLTHSFHHIPDVAAFLAEACRVLVPHGVISLIETSHTPFARWFFRTLHPEPYHDRAEHWAFPAHHSMLDSNQALSWIVFVRDAQRLQAEFPALRLERSRYLPWFSYLASGGVNLRSIVPVALSPLFLGADLLLRPVDCLFAIHWHLTIRRLPGSLAQAGEGDNVR